MAYVNGYDHDVFVSYAHQDNEPLDEASVGWVTTFTRQLQTELATRLGSPKVRVWWDPQLAGNVPLTPQLLTAIQRCATLVLVMSPSYLNSEWCARERNAFLDFAGGYVAQGRIFVVRHRETSRDEEPRELRDLPGYKLHVGDRDTKIDRPLSSKDGEYVQKLYEMSHHLKSKLQELNGGGAPAKSQGRVVFVARSTDDLEGQEDDLRRYLTQAGIEVLPKEWYPETNPESFRAAMSKDLARARVYAQLLSTSHGRKVVPASDQRVPQLQYEVALGSKMATLLFRDPKLDFAQVQDPKHCDLLERARACRFEEFKRAVLEEATREDAAARPRPANVLTFVDAEARDLPIAATVGDFLADQGVDAFWPVRTGTPEQVRRDLEQNLATCDGIILVYGEAEPFWVRDQLLQIRKIVSQREKPPTALALYLGPPEGPTKGPDLGFKLSNLITLDCSSGVKTEALQTFVQRVCARG